MIDFANEHLGTVSYCDSVVEDGFELKNLLNKITDRGFLASSFVKPPLDIFFCFVCPIELYSLQISAKGLESIRSFEGVNQ